jgi:F-type H+-transporting ATPase subunit a
MEELKPLFDFNLFGLKIHITFPIVEQWIIMLLIAAVVLIITRKLEVIPKGVQVWVETAVETINKMVGDIMGKGYENFNGYIGTIIIFLLMMNLFGLTGVKPPTAEYSVTLGLAVTSFLVIQGTALRRNGLIHYMKGLRGPLAAIAPIMFPLNVIERFTMPLSLSLRLFGNMFAASLIVELLYKGLIGISNILPVKIPLFAAVLPIPLHVYFDLFDGFIQMFIFVMLTMVNIKIIAEE